MTCINHNVLSQDEYVIKFGINEGMTVVRALSYDKIMGLSLEKLKLLFQPTNARNVRRFGLESIVNGRINEYRTRSINDFIDIVELSLDISSKQYKDKLLARSIATGILNNFKCRNKDSKFYVNVLVEMFENNEIDISLTHPTHFGQIFNLTVNDKLLSIVKMVKKKSHLLEKIFLVSMGNGNETKEKHFITTIFPSLVSTANPISKEGRRIRGEREIIKHIKEIKTCKNYDYTVEEQQSLIELLNLVIDKKAEYRTCNEV
jgi:hypothetical protein